MSELTQCYENAQRGTWKDPDPKECGCRGSGWFSSEVDTWHFCNLHGDPNGRHPEEPEEQELFIGPVWDIDGGKCKACSNIGSTLDREGYCKACHVDYEIPEIPF